MFDHMCEQAGANGIHLMIAHVLPQNQKMLRLLDTCAKPIHKDLSGGLVTLSIDISADYDKAPLVCILADRSMGSAANDAAVCR